MLRTLMTLTLAALLTGPAAAKEAAVGRFAFKDIDGNRRSLRDYRDNEAIVVAFLGTECPINNLYMPRLLKLHEKYTEKGVAFVGVYPNVHDTITEVAKHVRKFKLPFPAVKDFGNKLADQLGAERTPEYFVLSAKGVILYRGRLDDQYGFMASGQSYARPKPQRHDLRAALDEIVAGEPVSVAATETQGCLIGREREVTSQKITYAEHVAPLIQKHCFECHRDGQLAPFPLESYQDTVGWGAMIKEVLRERRMPPWHADAPHGKFRNDRSMTKDEMQTVIRWIDNGMPAGDLKKAPTPPTYAKGWRLGKPDMIFKMPKPFTVPATGTISYKYITIDTNLKEDIWVKGVEVRPGNYAVVHHIIMFVLEPGQKRLSAGQRSGFFGAYAPGSSPRMFPKGLAKRIKAGSRILFQMHYTANGVEQDDRSLVGLHLADGPSKAYVGTHGIANPAALRIPAGEKNSTHVLKHQLTQDIELLAFMPHTHLRGKSIKYEAVYPDGKQEVLLDVPRYDFNWQTTYELAEPKTLPKDTVIVVTGVFDNSESNPNNPDPTQRVRWGDQTWEEMLIGYIDYIPATGKPEPPGGVRGRKRMKQMFQMMFLVFDKNRDGFLEQKELPKKYQRRFPGLLLAFDKNKDKKIERSEIPQLRD